MKSVVVVAVAIFLAGCSGQNNANQNAALEAKVADLQKTVDDLKPGLGEIMGVIQQHHAKLYYAGTKSNWALAQYEADEIQEGLDDVVKYYPHFENVQTPLTELVPTMTKGALTDVRAAIDKKDEATFKKSFDSLCAACSSCHQAANHPFVKIQPPTDAMFSNQKFAP